MKTNRFRWFYWLVSVEVCCRSFAHAAPAPTTTLVATGSTWKYLDTGAAPGTAWRQAAFDDSRWLAGPAELGYGDGGEATVINGGPAGNHYITTYFRHAFMGPPGACTNLLVRLKRDDGAVVYLNGNEIWRSGIPPGTISSNTPASATIQNFEELAFFQTNIPLSTLLVTGTNMLAVEVHQVSATSSDVSFDLELVCNVPPQNAPPFVQLDAPINGAGFQVGTDITLSVLDGNAFDPDGTVTNVNFLVSGTPIGRDATPPYGVPWMSPPAGMYTLVAVAQDNAGASAASTNQVVITVGTNVPPVVSIFSTPSGGTFAPPANFFVAATASDASPGGAVAEVQFFANGSLVGSDTAPPYVATVTLSNVGIYALTAVATDNLGARGTSAPVSVTITQQRGEATLVGVGSNWEYWDRGTEPGSAWREPNFNAAEWSNGVAQLGFGDGDEATLVRRTNTTGAINITIYFRRSFTVADPAAFTNIICRLLRDDGGVIYINGVEVFRSNMPGGAVGYDTFASILVAGAEEQMFFLANVGATVLRPGTNLIAVEIHQQSLESSDVSFDLELVGQGQTVAPTITVQPRSQTIAAGGSATFQVAARGTTPLRYQWQSNGMNIMGATNRVYTIRNAPMTASGSYRVIVTNAFGAATSSMATLSVAAFPVITNQPVAQTASLGMAASFQVGASGASPLRYQWRLNGKDLRGQTSPTLFIPSANVTNGGRYSVVVANGPAAVASQWETLLFTNIMAAPSRDSFSNRLALTGISGQIRGTNFLATKESGEPNHAGVPCSNSVWYTWATSANGIATFRTVGSAFDTLLAVYTGTTVSNLTPVAADDERGGFYTSHLQFNARAGTAYQIAVDGHSGQRGHFVLTYGLEVAQTIPEIVEEPCNWSVSPGTNVTFKVGALGSGLTYQWFKNGAPIPGAKSNQLTLYSVQSSHVGSYSVVVSNALGRRVETSSAVLQLASDFGHFLDRFGDLGASNFWPVIETAGAPSLGRTNPWSCELPSGDPGVPPPEELLGGSPCRLLTGDYVRQITIDDEGWYTVDTVGTPIAATLSTPRFDCVRGFTVCDTAEVGSGPCGYTALSFYGYAGETRSVFVSPTEVGAADERIVVNFRWGCNPSARLSITREGDDVRLSWCDPSGLYDLESTPTLAPPDWRLVELDPDLGEEEQIAEDGTHTVTKAIVAGQNWFFRLADPAPEAACPDCPPE